MTIKSKFNYGFGWLCALPLLTGCGAKAVTFHDAADAIRNCGMSPEDVLWRVTDKDEILLGRKRSDAPAPSFEQVDCFIRWANENRIKIAFVGWEANGN